VGVINEKSPKEPKDSEQLEKIWKRIGLALFLLAIFLVAGPQVIDLVNPDFR
jgi:hypothetical protein